MMIRPIISLLKVGLFSMCMAFTANVLAEYYVVYPEIVSDMGPCCHHKYSHKASHHKRYKKNSRTRVETYYVWQTCGGALWVPRCGGCAESYTRCARVRCQEDFYIPPQYIQPNDDYNYYDDPPMDMRTADDF